MKRLDRVWNQMNLSISTKIRIYSTCVLAVLFYGSETWTLTQPDWKRLDSFHTRCQRRILHIRWYDQWPHYQWRSLTSNRSPRGLIHRPQTKAFLQCEFLLLKLESKSATEACTVMHGPAAVCSTNETALPWQIWRRHVDSTRFVM